MGKTARRLLRRIVPAARRPRLQRLWARRRGVLAAVALGVIMALLVDAAWARSWPAMFVAVAGLGAFTAAVASHRTVLRRRIADLERALAALAPFARDLLPANVAPGAVRVLLDRGDALDAHAVVRRHGAAAFDSGLLRRLWSELERRGYFAAALETAEAIPDRDRESRRHLRAKLAVLSGDYEPAVRPRPADFAPHPGRVLHLVGNSLPLAQTGYTLRTHFTAVGQAAAGLEPHVVTQMGFAAVPSAALPFAALPRDRPFDDIDGVRYHRIPGAARASVPLDEWLDSHVQGVADLVATLRPAVLHAASDYLNAITATVIGRTYGLPIVYESRGFWEETWLSRKAGEYGWDLDRLAAEFGLPDEYRLRRDLEDGYRRRADRLVTLSASMAERISSGGVDPRRITVIPNAVDTDAFPVLTRNRALAATFGISDDATVIGYISSIKEYEGIDTLIAAYDTVRTTSPGPVRLLVVGEGEQRPHLMRQVAGLGLTGVTFTGRVPHHDVLDYYSLIDVFVVPRKPVEVCHLVTPLKPFEAFSTGRTVVLSNVRALAAIAEQSGAAVLFEAGDEHSLAETLTSLLRDPARREKLATTGAEWVRSHGSWAANAEAYRRVYADLGAVVDPAADPALEPAPQPATG